MDDDGNVVVNGHPHIIIAPQGGQTGVGGDPSDATLAVNGDANFDGACTQAPSASAAVRRELCPCVTELNNGCVFCRWNPSGHAGVCVHLES